MRDRDYTRLRNITGFLIQRLERRPRIRKAITNTGWLFADKIVQTITNLLVSVWLARYLGPEQRGIMLYALAFVALFVPVAALGLGEILVRELVRQPDKKHELMGTVFITQTMCYVVFLPLMIGGVVFLRSGQVMTQRAVAVIAVGNLFANSRIFKYWFRSTLEAKHTVLALRVEEFVTAVIKIMLILLKAPLMAFVVVLAVQAAIGFVTQLIFYAQTGEQLLKWRFSFTRAKAMMVDSWPLAVSLFANNVVMRMDSVMLGQLLDDRTVGIYGEATRLSQFLYFIPMDIALSVYPMLVQAHDSMSPRDYRRRYQQFVDILAATGYLVAIPATLLAPTVINRLYGKAYTETGSILAIHVWAFLFISLKYGMNNWLMVENETRLSMWSALLGAVTNTVALFWLVPVCGANGAALAAIIASAASVFPICILSPRLHSLLRQLFLALLIPFRFRQILSAGILKRATEG